MKQLCFTGGQGWYSFQESESLGELSGGDLGWSPPLGGWLATSFL